MHHLATLCSVALLAASVTAPAADQADPLQVSSTKVFADHQDSTVKLTVTRNVKGKDQSFEVPALSLDGKGMFVASLKSMESGGAGLMGGMQFRGGEDEDMPKIGAADKGELTRVALLKADATEAEADLVITDAALDLALVRVRPVDGKDVPVPPAPPVAKTAPVLLDNLLTIERQGQEFQHIATTATLQVAAVTTTPRTFYIPSQAAAGGTAVYNTTGELVGVVATVHDECVIVPAAAILKLATTVPAKTGDQ